jgi:hypothetical protein
MITNRGCHCPIFERGYGGPVFPLEPALSRG